MLPRWWLACSAWSALASLLDFSTELWDIACGKAWGEQNPRKPLLIVVKSAPFAWRAFKQTKSAMFYLVNTNTIGSVWKSGSFATNRVPPVDISYDVRSLEMRCIASYPALCHTPYRRQRMKEKKSQGGTYENGCLVLLWACSGVLAIGTLENVEEFASSFQRLSWIDGKLSIPVLLLSLQFLLDIKFRFVLLFLGDLVGTFSVNPPTKTTRLSRIISMATSTDGSMVVSGVCLSENASSKTNHFKK